MAPENMNDDELMAWIDQQLTQLPLEQPSVQFTEQLMHRWQAQQTPQLQSARIHRSRWPLWCGAGFALVLLGLAIWLPTGTGNWNFSELGQLLDAVAAGVSGQHSHLLEYALVINALLGIVLLDRTVLKPYFAKRRLQIA